MSERDRQITLQDYEWESPREALDSGCFRDAGAMMLEQAGFGRQEAREQAQVALDSASHMLINGKSATFLDGYHNALLDTVRSKSSINAEVRSTIFVPARKQSRHPNRPFFLMVGLVLTLLCGGTGGAMYLASQPKEKENAALVPPTPNFTPTPTPTRWSPCDQTTCFGTVTP